MNKYFIFVMAFFVLVTCSQAPSTSPDGETTPDLTPDGETTLDLTPDGDLVPKKIHYYGESLLSGHQLKAYQHIMQHSASWNEGDSTAIGETLHLISFENTGILITRDDLLKILMYQKYDNVELYNAKPTTRYATYDNKGYVKDFKFRYSKYPSRKEFKVNQILIDKKINQILAKISPNMTDAQKIKVVHDELIKLVSYGGMNNVSAGDISGAFIIFKIICDGYAQALHLLFQRIGLESIYIVGNTPQGLHAWTKVKLDGEWYNIDPTWNDPMYGSDIEVLYDYFLIGDPEFSKNHTPESSTYNYPLPRGASKNYPFNKTLP